MTDSLLVVVPTECVATPEECEEYQQLHAQLSEALTNGAKAREVLERLRSSAYMAKDRALGDYLAAKVEGVEKARTLSEHFRAGLITGDELLWELCALGPDVISLFTLATTKEITA